MPISAHEQNLVQVEIDMASETERKVMRERAEEILADANFVSGSRLLSHEESHAAEIAIEYLTRLDAIRLGKGWWFRTKRRMQLVQMYLGN